MSKLKYLSYILLGLSAIFFIYIFLFSGDMTLAMYKADPDAGIFSALDGFLGWAYILTAIGALLALVLPIIGIVQDPKNIKKILINLGVMVALVLVSYFAASSDPLPVTLSPEPSASTLKLTSAGLIMTGILAVVAIGVIIGGGILNSIKNR